MLALLRSSTCLVLYSQHQHQPSYVCASFPFCYQDQQTGQWKSILDTSVAKNSLQRDVAFESSECWSTGTYCRSDASNLIKHLEMEMLKTVSQGARRRMGAKFSASMKLVDRAVVRC